MADSDQVEKDSPRQRCLVLVKGAHQYVFRVEAGLEERFLEALPALAENERLNFDWEDVAFFNWLVEDLRRGREADRKRRPPNGDR